MMLKVCLFLLLTNSLQDVFAALKRNNACRTFQDYYQPDKSSDCFYNPDMFLETPDLIEKYTSSLETHLVTTEDGYILTLFRMARKNPKGTILFQHPLNTNSRIWVGQGNESLALSLWNQGYDIWLANQRGTQYSDKHSNKTFDKNLYWDYTFHEIGVYDISAQVKLIKKVMNNNDKIIFIGHSLGTTTGLIYASSKAQEAQDHLKAMIMISTSCFYRYTTSPVFLLASLEPIFRVLLEKLQLGSVYLSLIPFIKQAVRIGLRMFPLLLMVTNLSLSFALGWTPEEMDPALLNYDVAIYLKNVSWKLLMHYLQIIGTKNRFQNYDYGDVENMKVYGSQKPPEYPLGDIKVPILFVSSANDSLTTLEDSDDVFASLSEEARKYEPMKVSGLNHIDYHFGKRRKEIVFDKIVSFIEQISLSA